MPEPDPQHHDPHEALSKLASDDSSTSETAKNSEDSAINAADEEHLIAAEIDDEDNEDSDAATSATPALAAPVASAAGRRPAQPAPRPAKPSAVKTAAVPLLVTVGVLLFLPGTWSIMQITGIHVPGWEREDARPMAYFMLLCWPVSFSLLAGAGFFLWQIKRATAARA
jgi:hypothetical protein